MSEELARSDGMRAKDGNVAAAQSLSFSRPLSQDICTNICRERAVGWSWAAVDSVKLVLVICLIARSIRLGSGLNPHKVWWAESACVKSYD